MTLKFNTQRILDMVGISLSLACAIHCAFMPIAMILFPILTSSLMADEIFHQLMLLVILPTSGLSFLCGCKRHKKMFVALFATTGFLLLVFAAFWGHDLLGETGEKMLTVAGGFLMACAHFQNYRLCRYHRCQH